MHPNTQVMLQELKIKNFLSFKEETTFSFEATKDTTFEDYQVVNISEKVRLLRFAVVYGANASGKSNLLSSLDFLSNFWFEKVDSVDDKTNVSPFLLDKLTQKENTEFELKFFVNNIRYWYTLELNNNYVVSEKLYFYKTNQPSLLFDRNLHEGMSKLTFNNSIVKISSAAIDEITLKCLNNMSFFAARNQVNINIPEIDAAKEWMRSNILPSIEPRTGMFDFASKKMMDDKDLRAYLLDFVKNADFNISDIIPKKITQDLPPDLLDLFSSIHSDIPDQEKERLKTERTFTRIDTNFEHTVINERGEEKYTLNQDSQSRGTKRTFGLEAAIYQAIQQNALLPIDELESSLHPELVEYILQKFLSAPNNRAQLLITTHYDPLLNTVDDLIRKDSVWFTDKGKNGATDLYSLVEFKGLNRLSSLQKAYRNGIFEAMPSIK